MCAISVKFNMMSKLTKFYCLVFLMNHWAKRLIERSNDHLLVYLCKLHYNLVKIIITNTQITSILDCMLILYLAEILRIMLLWILYCGPSVSEKNKGNTIIQEQQRKRPRLRKRKRGQNWENEAFYEREK